MMSDIDEIKCIVAEMFSRHVDELELQDKYDTHELLELAFGRDFPEKSPMFFMATGFEMGVNSGLTLAEAIKRAATM